MATKRALTFDETTKTMVFREVPVDDPSPTVTEHRFASMPEADEWVQPAPREPAARDDADETPYDRAYRQYVQRMRDAWKRAPQRMAAPRRLHIRRGAPRSRRPRGRPTRRPAAASSASSDGPAGPPNCNASDRGEIG